MKIVIATGNRHKKVEVGQILGEDLFDLSTMKEEGLDLDIVEDGDSFEENALIKAREVKAHTPYAVLADDSGLEVDFLNNAPGIYSARYAGEEANDARNNEKLLEALKDVPEEKRTARFVCVIAYIDEKGEEFLFRGKCPGRIAFALQGEGGFGYDPLFLVEGGNKTYAQLTEEEKNAISHRAVALQKAMPLLEKHAKEQDS
ncbi:RdgB/HAM1 family non-canonical purine NTP pyrophosphatase [Alkalibacter rhizosphaerae]|uniref:dITP/XTP pyrophosphatase n=1 Tax=Alkalibacter rhizosphaerae TaxID=2815577 RepID=A0A974XE47_9FIRM|nr:RdgB/HAM1 family non-canonical purine NTP pyrophosphatase [Alkalibacter rhizosphaerae]QSX08066.1 RdgB/HAM1 family non-canonical purine NTP pyrophosphatase [Alkalibacter rhizosphaerae]